jgi:hypothetical protein
LVQLGCEASFILDSARRRQRPAVDIDEDHMSDPSVRFVVEQQLINEFTIQAKRPATVAASAMPFTRNPCKTSSSGEDTRTTFGAYLLPRPASIAR